MYSVERCNLINFFETLESCFASQGFPTQFKYSHGFAVKVLTGTYSFSSIGVLHLRSKKFKKKKNQTYVKLFFFFFFERFPFPLRQHPNIHALIPPQRSPAKYVSWLGPILHLWICISYLITSEIEMNCL